MREITVKVSDRDFADMVRHLAAGKPGRPLVAVDRLEAVDGDEDFDLAAEVADVAAME